MYIQKSDNYWYIRRTGPDGKETLLKLGKHDEPPKMYYPELHNDKATNIIQRLPDNSVDCIITDPPYGIDYDTNRSSKSGASTMPEFVSQSSLDFLEGIPEQLERVLAPDSHIYVFARADIAPEMRSHFGNVFDWNHRLIWDKCNHGMGDLDDWAPRHEEIHHFEYGSPELRGKRPQDVLEYSGFTGKKRIDVHPHQKPRDLLEFLIEKSTDVGDVVFDPFGGSYATARAAMLTFRKAVSCEMSHEMHTKAEELADYQLHNDPENDRVDWTEVSKLQIEDVDLVRGMNATL